MTGDGTDAEYTGAVDGRGGQGPRMKGDAADVPGPDAAPLTPCVRVCRLDERGFCVGCQRSLAEIAAWGTLSDEERRRCMDEVLPARRLPMMDALAGALRPLSDPPSPPGWNHAAVVQLFGQVSQRPAAVLLGIRDDESSRLVFTVRRDHLQAHAGQVAFPGGGSEPGDGGSALATALRESQEEIGLDPELVAPLGYLDCLETNSGYCVTPVVARIAAHARLQPAPDEVAEVFEVPAAFFLDARNRRCYTMESRGLRRPMVEFVHDGHRIWGVTAAIIDNLLHRMGYA